MKRFIIICITLFAVSACSSSPQLAKITEKIPGLNELSPKPAPVNPAVMAKIDQIGTDKRSTIILTRVETNTAVAMAEVARSGDTKTYYSANRRSITLRNGIIIRTQGLGADLAALGQTNFSLGATGRVFTRVHKYLDGENQIQTLVFRCLQTTRPIDYYGAGANRARLLPIDESCKNDQYEFENLYFLIPNSRQVLRSRQWVSPEIGYLRVSPLAQ